MKLRVKGIRAFKTCCGGSVCQCYEASINRVAGEDSRFDYSGNANRDGVRQSSQDVRQALGPYQISRFAKNKRVERCTLHSYDLRFPLLAQNLSPGQEVECFDLSPGIRGSKSHEPRFLKFRFRVFDRTGKLATGSERCRN